jgi:hypothetical protein
MTRNLYSCSCTLSMLFPLLNFPVLVGTSLVRLT